ncbi:MAG: HAD-IIB family hydrolase [Rhodospirillales bacterium]|nr:HAD-IIB family hydrolase [Rhodospirillales bacterium]
MQPLSDFPRPQMRAIRYVLADIDDTITTHGRLTPAAYGAMARMQEAGLTVIPITGRPAGWCDHFARMWPIDGIVGENGAFYFRYDHATRRFHKRFAADQQQRRKNRQQLDRVAAMILRDVPGSAMASDQMYREADIAIDFCEDVAALSEIDIARIVSLMESQGLTAKVSSIHFNGWIGSYDKLTMTRSLLADLFDCDMERDKPAFVFVGDSPNDQPLFRFFPNAVGVANLRTFEKDLDFLPAYVTSGEAGTGFVELADALIDARSPLTV